MMKKVYFILIFLVISGISLTEIKAQSIDQKNQTVYKTSLKETPKEVKAVLKNYTGYKISSQAGYTQSKKGRIYHIRVQRGHFSNVLLIDEKGKVVGIESGEHRKK